jgi:outer membrane protein assembly factor BamD
MRGFRLSVFPLGWALCASLFLCACSSTPTDNTAGWSNDKLFNEAKDEAKSGAWDKAIGMFDKLEGRAAGTSLAQQAQLEKAFAQFKTGDKIQALATLERFLKLHPASPAVDYAMYLKGLINFNENLGLFSFLTRQDLSERDQKASKDSYEAFRELSSRFPDSKYASDARQRMTYIVNSLATYEVHVARYYFDRGAYVAAINRAQLAIADFQGVPAVQEALNLLISSYDALGMTELRDDTRRVLEKSFPQAAASKNAAEAKAWWKVW